MLVLYWLHASSVRHFPFARCLHCVSKNSTDLTRHNSDVRLIIFGRNVAERMCYQMVIYICLPTARSRCLPGETWAREILVEYCIALLANAKAHFVNSVTANCCQRRCGCRSCVARQQIIDERQRYFILNSIFAKFITQSGATLQKAGDEFFTYWRQENSLLTCCCVHLPSLRCSYLSCWLLLVTATVMCVGERSYWAGVDIQRHLSTGESPLQRGVWHSQ